jgi:hypothetical protein
MGLLVPIRRLDDVHVDAIVAEVLRRLNRPRFEAPIYAVDLEARVQVHYIAKHKIHKMRCCHDAS